eukprot:9908841-Alexandrium_andersonii.AAC.2
MCNKRQWWWRRRCAGEVLMRAMAMVMRAVCGAMAVATLHVQQQAMVVASDGGGDGVCNGGEDDGRGEYSDHVSRHVAQQPCPEGFCRMPTK